ncbi:LLM class flavin-dependent oxidoreductase [soil metagenome]
MNHVRVGCVYRPQFAPELLADAARVADDAGLDELWLWEDCFLAGGISAAAIALSNSARLTVGVGVLPFPMRNVAATALEIATLSRAFPGRVRIGLGHGVQDWMAQIGAKVASPMTLMREYVTALRALLDGDRVTVDGRYVVLDDVALDWPPEPGLEILCGAGGPRSLQLSGELASGTVITGGTTPAALRDAITHIEAGRSIRADAASHSVITYLLCATGPDASTRIREEIRHWGLDPEADVAVHGSPADIAEAAERWIDAGTDTIVFQPAADVDVNEFIAEIGGSVQPLIRPR